MSGSVGVGARTAARMRKGILRFALGASVVSLLASAAEAHADCPGWKTFACSWQLSTCLHAAIAGHQAYVDCVDKLSGGWCTECVVSTAPRDPCDVPGQSPDTSGCYGNGSAGGTVASWGLTTASPSGAAWSAVQGMPNGAFGAWSLVGNAQGLGHEAVGRNADGRLELFAVDIAAGLAWHTPQIAPNSDFGPWSRMFDAIGLGQIAVGSNADGRLELFGLDTAAGLAWHTTQDAPNGAFGGWSRLFDVSGLGEVAVGHAADGRLELFGLQTLR